MLLRIIIVNNFYRKSIRNWHKSVYDTNPFSAGTNEPSEQVLKFTVKLVPLSVYDDINVNRFIYVSAPLDGKVPPHQYKCAGLQWFIYNYGQLSNKRTPLFTYCWEAIHYKRDFPNLSRNKVCKMGGNSLGDVTCDHYTAPLDLAKGVPFPGVSDKVSSIIAFTIYTRAYHSIGIS